MFPEGGGKEGRRGIWGKRNTNSRKPGHRERGPKKYGHKKIQ